MDTTTKTAVIFALFFFGAFFYHIYLHRKSLSFFFSKSPDVAFLDGYSLCHLGTGFLYNFLGRLFGLEKESLLFFGLFGSSLWEIVENNHRFIGKFLQKEYPDYKGDTILNSISDIFMAFLAYIIGEKFFPSNEGYFWMPLIVFFGIDLTSQIVFGDSAFFRFIFKRRDS